MPIFTQPDQYWVSIFSSPNSTNLMDKTDILFLYFAFQLQIKLIIFSEGLYVILILFCLHKTCSGALSLFVKKYFSTDCQKISCTRNKHLPYTLEIFYLSLSLALAITKICL